MGGGSVWLHSGSGGKSWLLLEMAGKGRIHQYFTVQLNLDHLKSSNLFNMVDRPETGMIAKLASFSFSKPSFF